MIYSLVRRSFYSSYISSEIIYRPQDHFGEGVYNSVKREIKWESLNEHEKPGMSPEREI